MVENYLLRVPLFDWLFRTVGLGVVIYLAWLVAIQRQQLAKRLKETEIAKDHLQIFLGIVTHDLTQPLTALKLCTQIFLALIPQKTNLTQLLKTLVADQQALTTKHQIRLVQAKTITGTWDEGRLRQLFTNLISNAIKCSPSGGKIILSMEKRPTSVCIAIADCGLGMTKAQQEQLFQPFSLLHHGHTIKGMGLGLYICKAITDAHQGKIWVESQKHKGSIFFVELPLNSYRSKRTQKPPARGVTAIRRVGQSFSAG